MSFSTPVFRPGGGRKTNIHVYRDRNYTEIRTLTKDFLKFTVNSDIMGLFLIPFRLRAVSLFSVVRRAKRETREWPRA